MKHQRWILSIDIELCSITIENREQQQKPWSNYFMHANDIDDIHLLRWWKQMFLLVIVWKFNVNHTFKFTFIKKKNSKFYHFENKNLISNQMIIVSRKMENIWKNQRDHDKCHLKWMTPAKFMRYFISSFKIIEMLWQLRWKQMNMLGCFAPKYVCHDTTPWLLFWKLMDCLCIWIYGSNSLSERLWKCIQCKYDQVKK